MNPPIYNNYNNYNTVKKQESNNWSHPRKRESLPIINVDGLDREPSPILFTNNNVRQLPIPDRDTIPHEVISAQLRNL